MRYLLILLLFVLISCSHSVAEHELTHADNIMEEHPDSSLNILENIEFTDLKGEKEKALYALLMTQALTKNNIIVSDDSLINIASAYFSSHGSEFDRMRTYFYSGKVAYNSGNYSRAIVDAMQAYELAVKLKNDYWRAKSSELLSDIYTITYNHEEAEKKVREASLFYKKIGKFENYYYSILDRAIENINVKRFDLAINLIDSVLNTTKDSVYYDKLKIYGLPPLMEAYYYKDDIARADSISEIMTSEIENNYVSFLPFHYFQIAEIKIKQNNLDKAKLFLKYGEQASTPHDKIGIFKTKALLAKAENDYFTFSTLQDSIINLTNEITKESLKESPAKALNEYFNTKSKVAEKQKLTYIWIIIGLAIILLIVIAGSIIIHKIRIKIRESELENIVSEFRNSKSENNKIINTLFRHQNNTLNLLCDKFHERYDSGNDKINKEILSELHSEIKKIGNRDSLQEIEDSVNLYMDDIAKKLREECKFLKPDDYTFLILQYAGFTTRAVCMIMGLSRKNFYMKRTRLEKRIIESGAPDKEILVKYIR